MPIRVLSGGAWSSPIADGNLRVKSGGAWVFPSFCRVKVNNAWVDTGYRGYPGATSALWVSGWSFTSATVAWSPPSSGAQVANYQVEHYDGNGNYIDGYTLTNPIRPFPVTTDTRHQFRARALGTSGLAGPWSSFLRIGIGHPVSYNYGYVDRTRGWESGRASGARNMDDPFWHLAGTNLNLTGMHWRNLYTPQSSVVSPGTNRIVNWFINGSDFGTLHGNLGTVYSGSNHDQPLNNNGNNQLWGIVPRGVGWSTTSDGNKMLWCDAFWLSGTETYANYEIVSTNPEQPNYYW
jgi:hypothetical protein